MAVRQELHIEITPDGDVKITVKGAQGSECLELTRAIEQELGVVVDRTMTSEYYQAEATTEEAVEIGKSGEE